MDQITTDQLNTLATQFLAMGNAILAFRENNAGIDAADDAALEQLQNELLDKAGQLATMAAIQSGQEAAAAVNGLTQVNDQVTQTLQSLADVQKVIDIGTAALKVGVSVISMDPGDIVDAADGLALACNIKLPQA
jgi:hypothetical protein